MTITLTRDEAQQVLDAVSLAMSSHDVMLASDPPQDAWKTRGVQTRLAGAWATLRARLAQPEHEWQGLTDEEVGMLTVFDGLHHVEVPLLAEFIRAIEAKLKEKNA
jgi:hypothetical protein